MESRISQLAVEAQEWTSRLRESESAARQTAALRLCCGLDLPDALLLEGAARQRSIRRVKRFVERERLKGAAGHADYSLDRHIALSRSLAQLEGSATKGNGALRRRR